MRRRSKYLIYLLVVAVGVMFTFPEISNAESVGFDDENNEYTITYDEAITGCEYVLTLIKGTSKEYSADPEKVIDPDNVLYIDQKTASNKEITFTFPFRETDPELPYTILLSSNDQNKDNDYALVLGIDISGEEYEANLDEGDSYYYSGQEIRPAVSLLHGDEELVQNRDFTVIYSDNTTLGTGKAELLGTGKYKGSKNFDFNIAFMKPAVTCSLYAYNAIKVNWSASQGAAGYYIYYKPAAASNYTYLGTTSGETFSRALAAGTGYSFKVRPYYVLNNVKYPAYNDDIASETTTSNFYTLSQMGTPRVSKAAKKYVYVRWSYVPGASAYQIYRSKYKNKKFSLLRTVSGSATAVKIKTTRKKNYYYKIRAYRTGPTVFAPFSGVKKFKLK